MGETAPELPIPDQSVKLEHYFVDRQALHQESIPLLTYLLSYGLL